MGEEAHPWFSEDFPFGFLTLTPTSIPCPFNIFFSLSSMHQELREPRLPWVLQYVGRNRMQFISTKEAPVLIAKGPPTFPRLSMGLHEEKTTQRVKMILISQIKIEQKGFPAQTIELISSKLGGCFCSPLSECMDVSWGIEGGLEPRSAPLCGSGHFAELP